MDEYLKKNGFGSLDKYNEYVHETSKMDEASRDLGKKIKAEQTSFDEVYARLDCELEVSQIALDPGDVADLKEELKIEFGKDFSDAAIEKAEKQFNNYDNGDTSVTRKLNRNKRDIERDRDQDKDVVIEKSFNYDYYEHER